MKEFWKDIENFEGKYQVSNKGRIKSLSRYVLRSNGKILPVKEHILKPKVTTNDIKGNLIGTFKSINKAALALDVDASSISKVCKGKQKYTKGYVFKYAY